MDVRTALSEFKELQKQQHAYAHAMALIQYDAVTFAPSDSADGRGVTLGVLSDAAYEVNAGERISGLTAYLVEHIEELSPFDRRLVSYSNRENEYLSSIPKQEYVDYTMLINKAESVWHKAKPDNDFALFAPYLRDIIDANRRFAGYYKPQIPAYDVLMSQYEYGLTMKTADAFFSALRKRLVPLLARVQAAPQVDDSFLHAFFPVEKQRILSDYLMDVIGIDKTHCVLSETEHPFTTDFNKHDVRITTRYFEHDFANSLFSVIHEGGHALYELHGGDEYEYTGLSGGISMGIHESQSRMYENIIGRSPQFTALILPKIKELAPEVFGSITERDFYRAINKAQPSLIRTSADELTYSLHVMVRYELEKALIGGALGVKELPEAWNAKYKEYLGVTVPDDKNGVLQDSHWSSGLFGYFPSYALGSAYGAQMMACMKQDMDVDSLIAAGEIDRITEWLTERIYRHSCFYDPTALFEKCCGAKFDPTFYVDYLEKKYTDVYSL